MTSSRLLTLLSLLQTRRDWPGGELADRLEVSRRTIRRDVERLRALGYPVESLTGPAGGYRLAAGAAMPPLLLDDDEAIAIAVGLRTAARASVTGIEETSVRALVKLEQVLPAHLRRRVQALGATTLSLPPEGPTVDPQCLTVLAGGCRDRECVRFGYRARDGEFARREVEPHALVNRGRRWYLVCWDRGRDDWRTFRVDRITEPVALGARFSAARAAGRGPGGVRRAALRGPAEPLRGAADPPRPGRRGPHALRRGDGDADRRPELRVPQRRRQPRVARPARGDARRRVRGPRAARAGRAAARARRTDRSAARVRVTCLTTAVARRGYGARAPVPREGNMTRRWKVLAAACAAGLAMSGGAALAHDPEEFGTPLTSPFGPNFWFFANFQTAQNPFNAANTHVTSSDIAFWGDLAYVGDYGGFRIFDISQPTPKLVSDVRCYGPQGDPSVFDRDGDGRADTLVLSVDSVLAGPECGAAPAVKNARRAAIPTGAWEGLRIFDISNPRKPAADRDRLPGLRLAHEHAAAGAARQRSMYVLNSSYPLGDGPTCGPLGAQQGRKVNHGVVQVVEVPFRDPAAARELTELPIVYPGDADGDYKPVSEHGIVAPLDNFLGCHDLSSFPDLGHRRRGVRRAGAGVEHRPPHRPAGHRRTRCGPTTSRTSTSGTRRRSAGTARSRTSSTSRSATAARRRRRRPAACPAAPEGVRDRQHVLLRDAAAASCCRSSATRGRRTTTLSPTTGKYCSSHLGIPVPAKDRYLLVNAYYRGGSSVIDFSDPTEPKEIAFADMDGTNTWSAYTYPRRSGKQRHHPGLLQRRPEPQLRHGRPAAELPGGRVRLPALPRPTSAGRTWSASTASTRSCRSR